VQEENHDVGCDPLNFSLALMEAQFHGFEVEVNRVRVLPLQLVASYDKLPPAFPKFMKEIIVNRHSVVHESIRDEQQPFHDALQFLSGYRVSRSYLTPHTIKTFCP
jgi:hypothetical protein